MSDKVKKAEKVYKEWHQRDPRRVTRRKKSIPEVFYCVGTAKEILYKSNKWESKLRVMHDYIHTFDSSPNVYLESAMADSDSEVVAERLLGPDLDTIPLTQLGTTLELTIELESGEEHTLSLTGNPVLCATPDCKSVVILDRRGLIVVRGGKMVVESRGIVH